jgi:two-component sensor histidine kinase/CheY-like chemotaxis protein
MNTSEKVNILMVDDQPAKLLSYEAILSDLGENLIRANSGREALEQLLKTDIAIVLMDVSMPEIDGFELAEIIRQHPRYQKTAIIFVSAVRLTDLDQVKGYESGAVDYISVPVIPEILRAKVSVFAELYRKTQQLEGLNRELEWRVTERTAELHAANDRLRHELGERLRVETALRASLREKEILLQEVHHRVKNNLQVIKSLLRLQAYTVMDPALHELFRDSQNRVYAMALVHEQLYQAQDLAHIDFATYLRELASSVLRSYEVRSDQIALALDIDKAVALDIDTAIPLGLILTELVSNSVKHAFCDGRAGTITIGLHCDVEALVLAVRDDGIGISETCDLRTTGSLGLQLVADLADQLGGAVSIDRCAGTSFQIRIPYD